MKYLLPCFFLNIIAFNVFSQDFKVDTTTRSLWNGTSWYLSDRTINTYNNDCNLYSILVQNWDSTSTSWVNSVYTIDTYNANGFITSALSQAWNNVTKTWGDNSRQVFTYDGTFKLLSVIVQTYSFGSWNDFISTSYSYDKFGYVDSTLLQFAFGGPFQNFNLSINVNNSDGTPKQTIYQNWNIASSSWNNQTRTDFAYKAKNIDTATIYLWNSVNSSWDINQQQLYSYSGTGKLLNYLTQGWQTNNWVNQALTSNTYDNHDYLINYLQQTWSGVDWNNTHQVKYFNNSDGSIHSDTIQDWDNVSNIWIGNTQRTYSYSHTCSLPLKLLEFTASKTNNSTVILKWQTSEEINMASFTVQRSFDAINFKDISDISAKGASNYNNYSYNDNIEKITADKIYYRLKMFDKDGSFTYSKIAPVNISEYAGQMKLYPNPAKNQIFALLNFTGENAVLNIADISGKIVFTQSINRAQTGSIINLEIAALSKGVYFVTLISDSGISKSKFIKE